MANVYSIPPDNPFLPTLAEAIVSGRLIDGFCPAEYPLILPSCTLYLPTRRAARGMGLAITEALEKQTGNRVALLPRIRTLGDLDDEEGLDDLSGSGEDIAQFISEAAKVISPVERELSLARLAKGWIDAMAPEERKLFGEERIVLPSSAADALRLASDLAGFMDQVETEEVDWQALKTVVPDDYAEWWALTLRFLSIVMESWPEYLAQSGKVNPAAFRSRISDFRIKRLRERAEGAGPVIAAGSTGSIPATARLLVEIAGMKNGAVVLPGLDRDLPTEITKRFRDNHELISETAASTHPQHGMVKLLGKMGLQPANVPLLGGLTPARQMREQAVNISMLPAEDTGGWSTLRRDFDDEILHLAFENTTLVEAANERNEALTIALILREALEKPDRTTALVTPDRELARRVIGELERFGIGIDDSAGRPLVNCEVALVIRHMLRCCLEGETDPVSWTGFFRGPIAGCVLAAQDVSEAGDDLAGLMELALIRDCMILPRAPRLAEAVEAARLRVNHDHHAHSAIRNASEKQWAKLAQWAQSLSQALEPLAKLLESDEALSIRQLAAAILTCCERANASDVLFNLDGGSELHAMLCGYADWPDHGFDFASGETVSVFETLLNRRIVRATGRTHPRLHILGTLEARLQEFDRVVLGGLDEGTWPPAARNDPFLNRPMRSAIGLPLPERRIGLAAHDFTQLCGHDEVFLTRSLRKGDAPAISCRWLQRMETFLGKSIFGAMRERGQIWTGLAGQIDRPAAKPIRAARAEACPPVEKRPNSLSVTEIETWIRDPYAIYARHVLGLQPLPPLVREADAALRGTLYHAIFAGFIEEWTGPINEASKDKLTKVADGEFAKASLPAEIDAVWRPRFDAVAEAFLDWEKGRRDTIARSHCEVSGRMEIGETGFTLRGRADRIDELTNGGLAVLDYKTGTGPTNKMARSLAPQLALEGVMARAGAFKDVPADDIAALNYIRLKPGGEFKPNDITKEGRTQPLDANELADKMYSRLEERIREYSTPEQSYVSRYAPYSETQMSGDYDHLARVREWSIGEEEEGDEE